LIYLAGTGLGGLGKSLDGAAAGAEADIFFSHCHIDHIVGLPFFAPCYLPTTQLRLWAGNLLPEYRIEQVLRRMMAEPLFPIRFNALKARIAFHDFRAGDILRPHADITLRTVPLNHPGRATGYRLEFANRSIAYVTDTEHRLDQLDRNVLWLAHGAEILICDCNYPESEPALHRGAGRSSLEEAVRLAHAAGVSRLVLFHHDPDQDDELLDRIGAEARKLYPQAIVAAEGLTLSV
jgi:phosphoribosyl 1,2-cyclic phosphodiesterase